ncbi:MAG: hypothetical protein AAFY41_15720, partial [Bacteroidota bacterium]
ELEALNAQTEAKLALAGDNENRKAEILQEAQQREQQIRADQAASERRQFLFEQALSLAEVFIQTRLAVAKAVAISPVTFGEPFASYARIQGAISAAIIAAQTIPAFAEGTERVLGPGTETSDSIDAKLSKNERVVKASQNKEIGYDMSNEELVEAAKFYKQIPYALRGDLMDITHRQPMVNQVIDPKAISDPIIRQLKKQKGVSINVDRHGATVVLQKDLQRVKYLSDRFGIDIT